MTPYANFLYFAVAGLYVLLPVVVVGTARPTRSTRVKQACILVATAIMLAMQYSGGVNPDTGQALRQIWVLGAYALGQYLLACALLWRRKGTKAKWPGYVAVTLALSPLLAAKLLPGYAGPAAAGARGFVEFSGLSYVTLRVVDVLIGIHDGLIPALPVGRYFAFLLFFPTVSAGPIDRYRRFSVDWQNGETRSGVWKNLDLAIHRIFTGFFYKFVVAASIETHWLRKIPATPTLKHTLSYMYAYSGFLFFDFAGYSAFAIGFSYLLGVHTPENFRRPFLARDIKDFWTRWHITLSFWFRDFIYMRFLLAAVKGRWFRSKYTAAYLANFLTFGLMGLWHGTATCYLIYGLYHACLITGHDIFARWNRPRPDAPGRFWGNSLAWQIVGVLLTAHAVCFGFLIFSGRRLW